MSSTPRPAHHLHLTLTLLAAAALLVVATAQDAQAQGSIELKPKVGVSSANIDNTATAGDPIFNVGGGGQIAALLRFKGGIAAGFNFNYNYDSHVTTGAPSTLTERPTVSFSQPSFGVKVLLDMMPALAVGGWANYIFGSAAVKSGALHSEFAIQGFELGAEAVLNYQLKPYKTYILAGVYAYFQYQNLFIDTPNDLNFGDMPAENMGIGASLGVRFDFSL